jgi:hypothetical protein
VIVCCLTNETAGFSISFFETKPYVPTVALNYNTVAYICAQEQATVQRLLTAAFLSIVDLIRLGCDLDLDFGPAVFRCTNRVANVAFKSEVTELLKTAERVRVPPCVLLAGCR